MSKLQENLDLLAGHLKQFHGRTLPHRINGEDVTSERVMQSRSPVDDSVICDVAEGSASDIDAAARAAQAAFPAWRDMPGKQRKKILHAVADAIVARADEIALIESWDTGQCIRFMSKAALRGAENFRFFADQAEGARNGQTLPSTDHMNITTPHPHRSGRDHHPVEYTIYALHVENRASIGFGVHCGAQARGMVTSDRASADRNR